MHKKTKEVTMALRKGVEAIPEAESELQTISLVNAKGKRQDWQIIDVFEMGKQKYIALMLLDVKSEKELCVDLFRMEMAEQGGVQGIEISSIESKEEFQSALEIFQDRM